MSAFKEMIDEIRIMTLNGASKQYIAEYLEIGEDQIEGAIDILMDDPDFRDAGDFDEPESLSAEDDGYIYGTDEDYGADFYDGEFA